VLEIVVEFHEAVRHKFLETNTKSYVHLDFIDSCMQTIDCEVTNFIGRGYYVLCTVYLSAGFSVNKISQSYPSITFISGNMT